MSNSDWFLAHPSGRDAQLSSAHWLDALPGRRKSITRQAFFRPGQMSDLGVRVADADWLGHQKSRPDTRAMHPRRASRLVHTEPYGHLKFSKMWGRSVVNINTSFTDDIYYS